MAEIKDSQRKLPVLLETAQAPLNDATKQLADLTAALDTANKEKRSLEKDLEAHDAQTEKMRARLSELKTNKEYQAHLFEIEMANKKKGEIEERVLLCMERIEQHQKAAKEAQTKKAEAEKLFAEEKSKLDAQQATLSVELAELEKKHKEAAAGVEKNLLARYANSRPLARIRRWRRSAMASASAASCNCRLSWSRRSAAATRCSTATIATGCSTGKGRRRQKRSWQLLPRSSRTKRARRSRSDVGKGLQLRSRIARTLNVLRSVRLGPSLAAALPREMRASWRARGRRVRKWPF